jgi:hypothetical protein
MQHLKPMQRPMLARAQVHCRRKVPPGAGPPSERDALDLSQPEQLILDENRCGSHRMRLWQLHSIQLNQTMGFVSQARLVECTPQALANPG